MKSPLYAIAGMNGSDLFAAGTYKISDNTLTINGRPTKLKAIIARAGMEITSGKYTDTKNVSHDLDITLLTESLELGDLVTFAKPLHEIVIAAASAMFYFD